MNSARHALYCRCADCIAAENRAGRAVPVPATTAPDTFEPDAHAVHHFNLQTTRIQAVVKAAWARDSAALAEALTNTAPEAAPVPFGTFIERTDSTTEFRRTGDRFTPTVLGYTATALYAAPQATSGQQAELEATDPATEDLELLLSKLAYEWDGCCDAIDSVMTDPQSRGESKAMRGCARALRAALAAGEPSQPVASFSRWWNDKGQFARPNLGDEPADGAFERAIAHVAWKASRAEPGAAPAQPVATEDETANARAIRQALELIDAEGDMKDRMGAVRRILRGAVLIAEAEAGERAVDADGEAFREAARLGLTLRFYGGCAQSGMPGSPCAYEVENGSDRAASMREAVRRAAVVIAIAAPAQLQAKAQECGTK